MVNLGFNESREKGSVDDDYEIHGGSRTITTIESGVLPVSYVLGPSSCLRRSNRTVCHLWYVRTISPSPSNNWLVSLGEFGSTKPAGISPARVTVNKDGGINNGPTTNMVSPDQKEILTVVTYPSLGVWFGELEQDCEMRKHE